MVEQVTRPEGSQVVIEVWSDGGAAPVAPHPRHLHRRRPELHHDAAETVSDLFLDAVGEPGEGSDATAETDQDGQT